MASDRATPQLHTTTRTSVLRRNHSGATSTNGGRRSSGSGGPVVPNSGRHLCALLGLSVLLLCTAATLFHLVKATRLYGPLHRDDTARLQQQPAVRTPSHHQRHSDAERAVKRAELAAERSRWARWGSGGGLGNPRGSRPRLSFPSLTGSRPAASSTTAAADVSERYDFNYSQPLLRSRFTLPDPQLYLNDTMVVLIMSARGNFERRKAIRETWGHNHAIYFVVGGPSAIELHGLSSTTSTNNTLPNRALTNLTSLYRADIQTRLEGEQAQHHDLLDSVHPDSYQSLTHKVRYGNQWTLQHHPHVEWLVKVDDDTVVRVDTLSQVFLRNFNPHVPMVLGRIIEKSPVPRVGKWADALYPNAYYPFWPQGSCGYVLSRVVAEYVANTEGLVYYQGEDVSVGIWLDESDLHTTWIHSQYFSNDRKCLKHAWLVMGHEVTEAEMRECYEHADEWPLEDIQHKHRRYWKVENLNQRRD